MQTVRQRPTSKESRLTIRLSDSDRAIQKSAADMVGLTESEFVRLAVSKELHRLYTRTNASEDA
jgi:uncharacterized protein (DUF1778 family)